MDKERLYTILTCAFGIAKGLCNENFEKDYYYYITGKEELPNTDRILLLDENYTQKVITYDLLWKSARAINSLINEELPIVSPISSFVALYYIKGIVESIIKESEDGKKKE